MYKRSIIGSLLSIPFNKRKIKNSYIYSYVSCHRAEKFPYIEVMSEYEFNQTNKTAAIKKTTAMNLVSIRTLLYFCDLAIEVLVGLEWASGFSVLNTMVFCVTDIVEPATE